MAGDVIFTEGAETAAAAARQVETARLAEHQAFDQGSSQVTRQEAIALGGAAALGLVALLLLTPVPSGAAQADLTPLPMDGLAEESTARLLPNLPRAPGAPQAPQALEAPRALQTPAAASAAGAIMKSAADLATDVGRARDLDDLARLLGRVAELMDATGVVVWLGNTAGADLRAVLAHGYSPQAVARMPAVPRSGQNAAAAAYRTGTLQIVLSRPGGASGAIVAPILTADGCIGALSAEIKNGGEASQTVQALAMIFAAQLANVVSAAPAADAPAESKSASA